MRDGLHHGAPVGKRWKRAIKDVAERADYGEVGSRRIASALVAEFKADLRVSFIPALTKEVADEAGLLFKTDGLECERRPPGRLRGDLNDAEEAVAAAARRRVQMGSNPNLVLRAALADVLNERLENNRRVIFAHILIKAPNQMHDFRSRWSAAEGAIDTSALAQSIMDKSDRGIVRAREPSLDLDANLLGRR